MAELHYKDGGTWRKAKELHYRDGGTWRKLKEAWYRDGGTWRKVFSGGAVVNPLPVPAVVEDIALSPNDAFANITLFPDGSIYIYASTLGNPLETSWFSPEAPNIGAGYWVRLTVTAGTGPSEGDATAAWLSLATLRSWSWRFTSNSGGFREGFITIEVASDSAGATVVASVSGVDVFAVVEI